MTERGIARRIAPLLFVSGFCALVYQLAWTRQLRLVFGASTAASAAVVAIFIGGLGIGSLWLGKRVDRHPRPLELYALLEAIVAVSAALTPLLVVIAGKLYLALGGQGTLGVAGATAVRLVLAALVLGVPTLAMGGTLPAAARAIETTDDVGRTRVGLLYGINTLGAVVGCVTATFALLEILGTRRTLWAAALVNLLLAVTARSIARELPAIDDAKPEASEASEAKPEVAPAAPKLFVLIAAGVVGFAFFLMEIVWYRMLGPILGGTVFTFGLILATALLGIGTGGALYAVMPKLRRATVGAFAATCLLEALCVAVPFALGDRLAMLALALREIGLSFGFLGHVGAWTLLSAIVVLPAAIVAGFQFPLLIALAGTGRDELGRQIGRTYAANTVGAIIGSLAGGFGLLPLVGALGCWRAVAVLLVALGVVALVLAVRAGGRWQRAIAPGVVALVSLLALAARGPTAAWRHSAIGAGRDDGSLPASPNAREAFARMARRILVWEEDGVESSVGLVDRSAYSFVVNGKVDGNARVDAATQVMGGLVGAILRPGAKRSLVIGLGTGSTAGWLSVVPGMERVDVVELEPAVLRVARACAPVNQNVLDRPNVHVTIGDAREVLLASGSKWDIVFSEPSNPYRAGVSSLFTREYYAAVADHLADDGVFLQWVQAYEVDASTIRTIYATLAAEFPYVTTFELAPIDLVLIGSKQPIAFDAGQLRARVAEEPFRSALAFAWRTAGLEGFLARHIARPSLAQAIADQHEPPNTDDVNLVEFGFARALGAGTFGPFQLRAISRELHDDRPEVAGEVDWARVTDEEMLAYATDNHAIPPRDDLAPAAAHRANALARFERYDLAGALAEWHAQDQPPRSYTELEIVAQLLAEAGDDSQPDVVAKLRAFDAADADVIAAVRALHDRNLADAAAAVERALVAARTDPWLSSRLLERGLFAAQTIAANDPQLAPRMYAAVREPFSVHMAEDVRRLTALRITQFIPDHSACLEAAHALEPDFPWEADLLALRRDCYVAAHDPRAGLAAGELREEALGREGPHFERGLAPNQKN